ncbi:hypothetical protein G6F22_019486 [Rhizopus arrhizus]|nr:hypothetical protein G6F22_019486 [Rhizopus arrhizus]
MNSAISGRFGARGIALVEDAPAARQEQLALGGEGDAARAAMEQSHAQRVFQPGNALAGGRGGDALQAPGLDEAAGVGGVHEGLQRGALAAVGAALATLWCEAGLWAVVALQFRP